MLLKKNILAQVSLSILLTAGACREPQPLRPEEQIQESQKIAFGYALGGITHHLQVVDADGSNLTAVPCRGIPANTVYSPDGRYLYFPSERSVLFRYDLIKLDMDSLNFIVLVEDVESIPIDISDDGNWLAIVMKSGSELKIFTLSVASTDLKQLSQDFAREADFLDPKISPDGNRILFMSDMARATDSTSWGIFTMDFYDGGNITYLAEGFYPQYTPDGNRILYIVNDMLYIMNADGTDLHRIYDSPIFYRDMPTISSDGQWVIVQDKNNENELTSINLNDLSTRQLTSSKTNYYEEYPTFTPDGRGVLYSVKDSTGSRLEMINIDSGEITEIISFEAGTIYRPVALPIR